MTFTNCWLSTLDNLLSAAPIEVRGNKTFEMIGHSLQFTMESALLGATDRDIDLNFAFREAWWILSGRNDLRSLIKHAPSYGQYSDDGIRLSGAYGPKISDQLTYVLETLAKDPASRQAVINIWRERPGFSKDIPCTLSVQFLIRDGYIHTIVTMRSSDIWLGLPYDVFTFTMLTIQVALELFQAVGKKYELGYMFHNAGSRHLYNKNLVRAVKLLANMRLSTPPTIQMGPMFDIFDSSSLFHTVLHDRSIPTNTVKQISEQLPWIMHQL